MKELNTSLMRERFVVKDLKLKQKVDSHPEGSNEAAKNNDDTIIIKSNRFVIPLRTGNLVERFVIRGQNMHCVLRLASKMIQDFDRHGPLMNREIAVKWDELFDQFLSAYERQYNPDNWMVVYYKGKVVYHHGDYHPFLDIVEQCDAVNEGDYDHAVKLTENIFAQAGKKVEVDHYSMMGMVISARPGMGRCGLIRRAPSRNTTFSFSAKDSEDFQVQIPHCINVAAAYLEGINLSYIVGIVNAQVKLKILTKTSKEAQQADKARSRIHSLNSEVQLFQNQLETRYRPEQPIFSHIIEECEEYVINATVQKQTDTSNPNNEVATH